MHLIPYWRLSELPRILVITVFEIHSLLNHKNPNSSKNVIQFIVRRVEALIGMNIVTLDVVKRPTNNYLFRSDINCHWQDSKNQHLLEIRSYCYWKVPRAKSQAIHVDWHNLNQRAFTNLFILTRLTSNPNLSSSLFIFWYMFIISLKCLIIFNDDSIFSRMIR
jgi:hypothetical protein